VDKLEVLQKLAERDIGIEYDEAGVVSEAQLLDKLDRPPVLLHGGALVVRVELPLNAGFDAHEDTGESHILSILSTSSSISSTRASMVKVKSSLRALISSAMRVTRSRHFCPGPMKLSSARRLADSCGGDNVLDLIEEVLRASVAWGQSAHGGGRSREWSKGTSVVASPAAQNQPGPSLSSSRAGMGANPGQEPRA